jgi:hypothetical protein
MPARALTLPRDEKHAIRHALSRTLSRAIDAADAEQPDVARASGLRQPDVSRACNPREPHTLGDASAIMLCRSSDPKLRAVGTEYIRAMVALAGLGEIDESRHATGETLHRLAVLERETSEAKLALLEGAAPAHAEREAQEAADAWQAEANAMRALRLGVVRSE